MRDSASLASLSIFSYPGHRSARSAMVHDLGWRTLRRQDGVHALWSASTSGRVRATIVYDWRLHRRTQLVSTSWSYLLLRPPALSPLPFVCPFTHHFAPSTSSLPLAFPSSLLTASLAPSLSPLPLLIVMTFLTVPARMSGRNAFVVCMTPTTLT